MMEDTGEDILRQRPSVVTTFFKRIGQVSNLCFYYSDQLQNHLKIRTLTYPIFPLIILQTYQIWLDKWTPHTVSRWIFTVALIVAFLLRIVLKQVRLASFPYYF